MPDATKFGAPAPGFWARWSREFEAAHTAALKEWKSKRPWDHRSPASVELSRLRGEAARAYRATGKKRLTLVRDDD